MIKIPILTLLNLNNRVLSVLFLGVFLLTACEGGATQVDSLEEAVNDLSGTKFQVYEVKDCTLEGSCFFEYSLDTTVYKDGSNIVINDKGCKVYFGLNKPKNDSSYDEKVGGDEFLYWFKKDEQGELITVGKFTGLENTNYDFWLYNEGLDITSCEYLIDRLADSFTNRLIYLNEEFGFKVPILSNYKVEYLLENEGMMMRRTVSGDELKRIYNLELVDWPSSAKEGPDESPYQVIIGITAMENLMGYKDLGEYLRSECADCTLDFSEKGVFVGEDKISYSERVYLAISEDRKTLYRAFLRLPRYRFKYHQKGFDAWANAIEFF